MFQPKMIPQRYGYSSHKSQRAAINKTHLRPCSYTNASCYIRLSVFSRKRHPTSKFEELNEEPHSKNTYKQATPSHKFTKKSDNTHLLVPGSYCRSFYMSSKHVTPFRHPAINGRPAQRAPVRFLPPSAPTSCLSALLRRAEADRNCLSSAAFP